MGTARVPYAGPVDFGGYPGDRRYIATGRILYPALEAKRAAVMRRYEDAIQQLCKELQ